MTQVLFEFNFSYRFYLLIYFTYYEYNWKDFDRKYIYFLFHLGFWFLRCILSASHLYLSLLFLNIYVLIVLEHQVSEIY